MQQRQRVPGKFCQACSPPPPKEIPKERTDGRAEAKERCEVLKHKKALKKKNKGKDLIYIYHDL